MDIRLTESSYVYDTQPNKFYKKNIALLWQNKRYFPRTKAGNTNQVNIFECVYFSLLH